MDNQSDLILYTGEPDAFRKKRLKLWRLIASHTGTKQEKSFR
jgi:hypothetical protein